MHYMYRGERICERGETNSHKVAKPKIGVNLKMSQEQVKLNLENIFLLIPWWKYNRLSIYFFIALGLA